MAERGVTVVYGGGMVGLMGAVADSAIGVGGKVIGVIPQALVAKEIAHPGLEDLRVVSTMHERKALMADLSDGFLVLPGGFGTMEEFFEVLTWTQLGIQDKPCGFLNTENYYRPLMTFLQHIAAEGFVERKRVDAMILEAEPEVLVRRLLALCGQGEGRRELDPTVR
jgi:uncharacterized protein (TIGR00730 family)